MRTARAFLTGIIDYAGLFPPASLPMRDAVTAFRDHLAGSDRDLLGRFVVTAARLDELAEACRDALVGSPATGPWRLSVIAGADITADRESILQFNCSHQENAEVGYAIADAVELRVETETSIASALSVFPDFFQLFLEIPIDGDPEPLISSIKDTRAAAKIRTGGVIPGSIPEPAAIVRFLRACSRHRVPFKATAGLHHALRGEHPLTYEPGSPKAEMFGFLNVFLAAAFIEADVSDDEILAILTERDPQAFRFDDTGVAWRELTLGTSHLEQVRRRFALSYGSCSFTEPVSEARLLGLI